MILYHGSYAEIAMPDLLHSRANVDFGRGFYTTPLYDQAVKWCSRFKKEESAAVISRYSFDFENTAGLKILRFETYSENWLDFVLNCRRGQDRNDYDIVTGGVANDRVFNTVELYFSALIDKAEALKRLKYAKPNLQIAFRTQATLDFLRFEGSETL